MDVFRVDELAAARRISHQSGTGASLSRAVPAIFETRKPRRLWKPPARRGKTEMELRLLTSQDERRVFNERLTEARKQFGIKFEERPRSRLAQIQLAFANLYGLFESDSDGADRMLAGLAMHDLEMFPQTCTTPNLSHLPPWSVIEISDLWSLSRGPGFFAWCAAAAAAGPLRARALLAYLAVEPSHSTAFYTRTGFTRVGEPIDYPFVHTLDGRAIRVQPMVLEGEALQRLVQALSHLIVDLTDAERIVFRNCSSMRSFLRQPLSVSPDCGHVVSGPAVSPSADIQV
jgi:hypothetical protein